MLLPGPTICFTPRGEGKHFENDGRQVRRPSLLALEEELQSSLHGSRRANGAAEASELRVLQAAVHATESFTVEGIKHFPTELEPVAFGEVEILRYPRIPAVPTGIEQSGRVTANVPLGALLRNNELGCVEIGGGGCAEIWSFPPIVRFYGVNARGIIRKIAACSAGAYRVPSRRHLGLNGGCGSRMGAPDTADLPTAKNGVHNPRTMESGGGIDKVEVERLRHVQRRIPF